jgi:hypothetical protein
MKVTLSSSRRAPRAFALAAALALLSNNLLVGVGQTAAAKAGAQRLADEQRVVHVLNRLAFGARPGEVERVRKLGLEAYIEQQLNPSKLDDSAMEARLRGFPTLGMSNGELLAKYPRPGQLLRRLERAGELPPELAALVRQRNQGQPNGPGQMNQPDAERVVADATRSAASTGRRLRSTCASRVWRVRSASCTS